MIQLRSKRPLSVKHEDDIGIDLYADEDKILYTLSSEVIRTGVHVEYIEPGYWLQILGKSSENNLVMMAGVIDPGYRGEIGVRVFALESMRIRPGNAIAQLVIHRAHYPAQHVRVNDSPLLARETAARKGGGGLWNR